MQYLIERKLEFKTVKPRWEPQTFCDTLQEAEEYIALFNRCAEEHGFGQSKGGGKITEYRITEYHSPFRG
jgi:hypothetical protein